MSEGTTEVRPRRKSLGEQLDRLDGILDTLAEGLPQAVSDAARAGARAVVKDVLIEILTDPELRRLIPPARGETRPTRESGPSSWQRMTAAAVRMCAPLVRRWRAVRVVLGSKWPPVPARRVLGVSAGAGLVAGASVFLVPSAIAAVLAGIGAAWTALAVQLALGWARAERAEANVNDPPAV